jgi:A/G-specific adenine glycosylase
MDLGATLCTRRKPDCARCPLAGICAAHRAGIAERLPAAGMRRERPQRATVVMLVRTRAGVLLEKRPDQGIWGGLWGLPEVAGVDDVRGWCVQAFGRAPERLAVRPVLRHGFTHFDLDMTPVEIEIEAPARALDGDRWLWYNVREPAKVGLAAPVSKLLQNFGDS